MQAVWLEKGAGGGEVHSGESAEKVGHEERAELRGSLWPDAFELGFPLRAII